ncbi:hypothetical protein V8E51_004760 [Hyaloscypha variabilis]
MRRIALEDVEVAGEGGGGLVDRMGDKNKGSQFGDVWELRWVFIPLFTDAGSAPAECQPLNELAKFMNVKFVKVIQHRETGLSVRGRPWGEMRAAVCYLREERAPLMAAVLLLLLHDYRMNEDLEGDGEPVGWDENAIGAFAGREFSSAANAKMMYLSFEYIFLLVQKRMHVGRTPHMTCRDGQNERHVEKRTGQFGGGGLRLCICCRQRLQTRNLGEGRHLGWVEKLRTPIFEFSVDHLSGLKGGQPGVRRYTYWWAFRAGG